MLLARVELTATISGFDFERLKIYGEPNPEHSKLSYDALPLVEPDNPGVNDAAIARPTRLIRPGVSSPAREVRSIKEMARNNQAACHCFFNLSGQVE